MIFCDYRLMCNLNKFFRKPFFSNKYNNIIIVKSTVKERDEKKQKCQFFIINVPFV